MIPNNGDEVTLCNFIGKVTHSHYDDETDQVYLEITDFQKNTITICINKMKVEQNEIFETEWVVSQ